MSSDNLFVASNSNFRSSPDLQIAQNDVDEAIAEPQIATDTLLSFDEGTFDNYISKTQQKSQGIRIDHSKKAILLDYVKDVSEAKELARKYKDSDIYIIL